MSYLPVAFHYLPDMIHHVLRTKNLFPFWATANIRYFFCSFSAVLLPRLCGMEEKRKDIISPLFSIFVPELFFHSAEFSIRDRPLRNSVVKGSSTDTNLVLQD